MNNYEYPDFADQITMKFIHLNEYFPNYWSRSEQRILSLVKSIILENCPLETRTLLDAGCGEGRLIPVFLPFVAEIMAIEPDFNRYIKAKEETGKHPDGEKAQIVQTDLSGFQTDRKFDIVLSSHVIQHIPTPSTSGHLKKLAQMTEPGGLLIINTCHTVVGHEIKVVNEITEKGDFIEHEINEEEFNKFAVSKDRLPMRKFCKEDLEKNMEELGFESIFYNVFHVSKEDQKQYGENVDEIINDDEVLQSSHGRDMSVIFRKRK